MNKKFPEFVDKTQLEISYSRGSGNGGQKKQKTSSKCTIKHLPTGIIVTSEAHREQSKNKQDAFRKLAEKLVPIMREHFRQADMEKVEERIRTYKENSDTVKDERIPETFSFKNVMEGEGLDKIISSLKLLDSTRQDV